MKKINSFSITLLIALFSVSAINAQTAVLSGSFQFKNDINKRVGVIILQLGTQKFDMPISENIIIANLLPGRYSLVIEYQSGGRGGQMTRLSQNVEIESERRSVCRMNGSAVLSFTKEYERNSLPIFTGNHQENRRDFDNHNRHDNREIVTPVPLPMPLPITSDADFNKLYNSVKNEKFADTKMRTLKTSTNFLQLFTSEQVKRLALLFTQDSDKLECVKHLVPKVTDVQNLPFIKDVFTFDATKNDYLRFLNGR